MTSTQWVGGDFNDVIGVPSMASRDATHLDFFFELSGTGATKIWKMSLNETLGTERKIKGVPAVLTNGQNVYSVFAWGDDNHLWHLAKNNNKWLPWSKVTEGKISTSPTVVAVTRDRMDVFFRDSNGQMSTTHWESGGSWSPW
jgi:hypothetical protein